jgi:4-hydroxy-tetrahydrodipicolinate synthase
MSLYGVFPVLQTPFDDRGQVDEACLRREVDWVFEAGAAGVTVAMVSEILRLEHDERRELAALVCDAAAARGPVVISVGAESTAVAGRLAEHAQAVGATAVMAIPPVSVTASEIELYDYYETLLTSTELPVVVQDASSYVGSHLPVGVMARLHESHPERVYFKPEAQPLGPRLSALLAATGGSARAFDGSGGVALVETHRRGIVGSMPASDVCWAVVRMWQALERGDYDRAYKLSLPLSALLAVQTSLDSYIAVEKYLLVKQEVLESPARRGPLEFNLDETTAAHVDKLFGMLQAACEHAG